MTKVDCIIFTTSDLSFRYQDNISQLKKLETPQNSLEGLGGWSITSFINVYKVRTSIEKEERILQFQKSKQISVKKYMEAQSYL